MAVVTKDILLSLVLMAIGAFGFLYIQYGPGEALQVSQEAQITFRSFPSVISLLLLLLSGMYGASSALAAVRARRHPPRPAEGAALEKASRVVPPKFLLARTVSVPVLLIGFAQSIGVAPLFVVSAIFLFIAFFVFGQTNWVRMAVVATVGGALFHGLFVLILDLPLR